MAAGAVANLRDRVAAATEQLGGQPDGARFPCTCAPGPLGSYGGQSLVSEQMALLGLDNVFGSVPRRYFEPSAEELFNSPPTWSSRCSCPRARRHSRPTSCRRIVAAVWPALLASAVGLLPFTVFSTFLVSIADAVDDGEAAVGTLRGLGGIGGVVRASHWPR